jgi:hypothetical protein
MTHTALDPAEYAALERLLKLALNDSAAARCAADFLLAWHDAEKYGGFDPAALWDLKESQAADVLTLLGYIARAGHRLAPLGLSEDMGKIAGIWRPQGNTRTTRT